MGTIYDLALSRSLRPTASPPGCRGAACPAFALCQGRCAGGEKGVSAAAPQAAIPVRPGQLRP